MLITSVAHKFNHVDKQVLGTKLGLPAITNFIPTSQILMWKNKILPLTRSRLKVTLVFLIC